MGRDAGGRSNVLQGTIFITGPLKSSEEWLEAKKREEEEPDLEATGLPGRTYHTPPADEVVERDGVRAPESFHNLIAAIKRAGEEPAEEYRLTEDQEQALRAAVANPDRDGRLARWRAERRRSLIQGRIIAVLVIALFTGMWVAHHYYGWHPPGTDCGKPYCP